MKKLLSVLLAVTMIMAFAVPAMAEGKDFATSGQLGENITWVYDQTTETLTLSGSGATYVPSQGADNSWQDTWQNMLTSAFPKHVVIEEGIESLFTAVFHYGHGIETISLPTTLKEIPDAFIGWNGPSEESPAMNGYSFKGMSSITIPEGITSLTSSAFYYCWGISDYYLPSTLTEIDLDTLCYVANSRVEMGVEALNTTIHFAGTEEQWAQVKHVTGSRIGSTGLTDAELEELFATFTVVFEPKEEVKEEITIEGGAAKVPDTSVEITEGEDVVIDVTDTAEKVDSVVIGSETVDKIADADTSVAIKLPDVTVSFDKDAIGSIGEQAGDMAVTIVAKEVEDTVLTTEQKAALEEKEVCAILNLEALAGETKITEFGGGKVTVSVPFELPEGKAGANYYVAYIAGDGTITAMPTAYAEGMLTFETTHFSHYVVLEKVPGGENPPTSDGLNWLLVAVLVIASTAGAAVCVLKRKAF